MEAVEKKRKRKKRAGIKNPNGYGGIRKLGGNRRNPYQIVVTTSRVLIDGKMKQIQKAIGYAPTREEAMMLLGEYNRNPFDVSAELTFEDIWKAIDKSRIKEQNLRGITTAFNRCESIHNAKIRDIKKPQLQKIADSLIEFSPATQLQVRQLWKMIFRYAMENDVIQKDYSSFVRFYSDFEPRDKKPFTANEVSKFSDDLVILCYTGLRISEYLALELTDIKDGYIFVKGTKTAAADRIVPIHENIAVMLTQRLTDGNTIGYHDFLMKRFIPEMEALGIEGHTIHDTRRSWATFASRSKMDAGITKRILGHKLNDITEDVYTHKNYEDLRIEMDKFKIV